MNHRDNSKGLNRRRMLNGAIAGGVTIVAAGLQGKAMAASRPSPTNPQLLYSFNPRGFGSRSYVGHLTFSPSGRYLAMNCEEDMVKGPIFAIWDMHERRITFRTDDYKVIPPIMGPNQKPFWAPDESWVSAGGPIDGTTFYGFYPEDGRIMTSLILGSTDIALPNKGGDKILIRRHATDIGIFDMKTRQIYPVSLKNCVGTEVAVQATAWIDESSILIFGSGWAPSRNCNNSDVETEKEERKDVLSKHYIAILNPFTGRILESKNFSTPVPWENWIVSNITSGSACLAGRALLRVKGREVDNIIFPPNSFDNFYSDAAFNNYGDLLYLSKFDPEKESFGAIIDVKSNNKIGEIPSGKWRSYLDVSANNQLLALARDEVVEIYALG